MYQSHPLEDAGVPVYLSSSPPSRHHSPRKRAPVDDFNILGSSFETVHPLDECQDCHSYTKHVDQTFLFDLPPTNNGTFADGVTIGRRRQLEEDNVTFSRYRGRLHAARKQHDELLFSNQRYRQRVESLEAELTVLRDRLMATQLAYDDVSANVHGAPPMEWTHSYAPSPASSPSLSEMQITIPDIANDTPWHRNDGETSSQNHPQSSPFNDEDDFLFTQQLHFMDGRQRPEEGRFWADLGNGTSSDSDNDGYDTISSSSSSAISSATLDTSPSDESDLDHHQDPILIPPLETELSISELSTLIEAAQEDGNTDAVSEVKLLVQDAHRTPRKKRTAAQLYLLLTWRTPSWVYGSPRPAAGTQVQASVPLPSTSQPNSPEIFVDASAYGIGLVMNGQWLAWKFKRRHPLIPVDTRKNVVMSWAELIAVELGVLTLIEAGYRDARVVLRSDNLGVVKAMGDRQWTAHYGLDGILQRILGLCRDSGLNLTVKWVSTKVNPADKPSRGVFPPSALKFPHSPALPTHLSGILTQVSP